MPVFIGMPGPVDRTKLLMMATKIGVGESTRFLAKHRGTFARLAAPGGFTGERFIEKTVQHLDVAADGIAGLHIFTFNQIAETEAWRRDLLARLGGPISAVS
jgi:methylenetetrahydrofolate reductase (NADPH)